MRAISMGLALVLAGCGGPDKAESQGENIALAPEVLVPKPTATSVAGVDLLKPIEAFGTEPYWALDITDGRIRFEDFGIKDGVKIDWAPQPAKVTGNMAVTATTTPAGEAVTITLVGESCLEVGEEENSLPLKATVKIGARTLTGCAGQKLMGAAGAESDNAISSSADNAGI